MPGSGLSRVAYLVVGPDEHGVVRFGQHLTRELQRLGPAGPAVRTTAAALRADPDAALAPITDVTLVHTQYTDRLFGDHCEDSAQLLCTVAGALASRGQRLSATLHDLPTAGPLTVERRRSAAYRQVAAACAGRVVVSSRHELRRLAAFAPTTPTAPVIPLPIDPPADPRPAPRPVTDVAVLGFVYPGKGHDDVLRALAGLPAAITLTALGRVSDGHGDLLAELHRLAAKLGRSLSVTGFVPDRELPTALRSAGIAVAPHRLVSASGSIATWLTAGRRPLVPDGRYTRELEQRCPGALWLYDATDGARTGLVEALQAAVAEPERTWLGDIAVGPTSAQVAAAYGDVLAGWA